VAWGRARPTRAARLWRKDGRPYSVSLLIGTAPTKRDKPCRRSLSDRSCNVSYVLNGFPTKQRTRLELAVQPAL
jgi:hypothetical protein